MRGTDKRQKRVKKTKPNRGEIFVEMMRVRHVLLTKPPPTKETVLWAKGQAAHLASLIKG